MQQFTHFSLNTADLGLPNVTLIMKKILYLETDQNCVSAFSLLTRERIN
jgi:hypothetical protein